MRQANDKADLAEEVTGEGEVDDKAHLVEATRRRLSSTRLGSAIHTMMEGKGRWWQIVTSSGGRFNHEFQAKWSPKKHTLQRIIDSLHTKIWMFPAPSNNDEDAYTGAAISDSPSLIE